MFIYNLRAVLILHCIELVCLQLDIHARLLIYSYSTIANYSAFLDWIHNGSLTIGRYGHTASLLSNWSVLIAGRFGSTSPFRSAELYNSHTGVWITAASMTFLRDFFIASVLNDGRVLAVSELLVALSLMHDLNILQLYWATVRC